jgi:serine protease Do
LIRVIREIRGFIFPEVSFVACLMAAFLRPLRLCVRLFLMPSGYLSRLPPTLLAHKTERLPFLRFLCFLCYLLLPCLSFAQEPSPLATAAALERLMTEAIERAEKSVVAISRVRKDDAVGEQPPIAALPLPGSLVERASPTDPRFVPTEFGTGVVIEEGGLIVTNYHVLGNVRQADFFVWQDRKPYRATVKAADPWLDLAVLRVDGSALRPIPLGDARSLKKGQFVIALGNPYAIARDGQPSASWGIVSNLERQAPAPRTATRAADGRDTLHHYGTLIQTDARLELGASGGALVNLQGEMVGLTTSLAALYGYERPGGFAIPVDDDFRRALDMLKTGRVPDYGLLGVEPAALAVDLRQRGRTGARIRTIADATPAKQAGLREGDVITQVDGANVGNDLELIRRLSGQFAGTSVTLSILRGSDERRAGQPMNIKVKLAKKRIDAGREPYSEVEPETWRGLRVEYATASPLFAERSRDLDPLGCLGVVEVARDSSAWKAGLRPGDFVSHVGPTRVTTPREFYDAVTASEGEVNLRLTGVERSKALRTVEADSP